MFEKVRPANWKIFKQPSGLSVHAENTLHLPKNYYKNLAVGKDEMYKRIYIDGQYGYLISGKPVFASFVDNVHVARQPLEPMKGLDVLVGFDFGLQPACLIGQITPLGQLRILDELVSDGMGLRQFCDNQLLPLLRKKYFGMNVMGFGDPSGTSRMPTDESTCFEILQGPEVGLRSVVPATTNAILPRISAVESFLNKMYAGEPGFILSPNCHFIRKALNGGYHYEKDPKAIGDEYKPMPLKNFSSHICFDGDTMVLTPVGEKRIKDIKSGDEVVTPYGNRKVVAAGLTHRNANVMELTLSTGKKIICTENHEFVVADKSIAKSNALQYNDVLQGYESWRTLKWSIQSLLSLKARSTGFRRVITTGQKAGARERATCTEPFGSSTTNAGFPMDMPSTTLMATSLTMTYPIWDWSLFQNTLDIISRKELQMGRWITKRRLFSLGRRQERGTDHLRGLSGIENTEKSLGKIERFMSRSVSFVEKLCKRLFLPEKNTAMPTVRQSQESNLERMTFKERVLFVVQTLKRINILKSKPAPRIVQISQLQEPRDVYNITVDIDHVYFANGVLSCNCDALQYLCMYIGEREENNKKWKAFRAQIKTRNYQPAIDVGGY
jgi:hypothetical protein